MNHSRGLLRKTSICDRIWTRKANVCNPLVVTAVNLSIKYSPFLIYHYKSNIYKFNSFIFVFFLKFTITHTCILDIQNKLDRLINKSIFAITWSTFAMKINTMGTDFNRILVLYLSSGTFIYLDLIHIYNIQVYNGFLVLHCTYVSWKSKSKILLRIGIPFLIFMNPSTIYLSNIRLSFIGSHVYSN